MNKLFPLCFTVDSIGSGGWAYDGVEMVSNETEDGVTTIICNSTHLTSFAVLVDVSGTLNPGVSSDQSMQ